MANTNQEDFSGLKKKQNKPNPKPESWKKMTLSTWALQLRGGSAGCLLLKSINEEHL